MLIRLRIEMFSFAKAMQGELLDEFWRSIDELQALRPKPTPALPVLPTLR